jgi:hypothetical protein
MNMFEQLDSSVRQISQVRFDLPWLDDQTKRDNINLENFRIPIRKKGEV